MKLRAALAAALCAPALAACGSERAADATPSETVASVPAPRLLDVKPICTALGRVAASVVGPGTVQYFSSTPEACLWHGATLKISLLASDWDINPTVFRRLSTPPSDDDYQPATISGHPALLSDGGTHLTILDGTRKYDLIAATHMSVSSTLDAIAGALFQPQL
jgi:hypothetical protein